MWLPSSALICGVGRPTSTSLNRTPYGTMWGYGAHEKRSFSVACATCTSLINRKRYLTHSLNHFQLDGGDGIEDKPEK
ncbi:hypothetical protein CR513_29692, partial [Mucuna pruriens]